MVQTYKPKSIQENEAHKILWDFEIQTDNLIPTKIAVLILIRKKKESLYCEFYRCSRPQSEDKRQRKDKQILGPC